MNGPLDSQRFLRPLDLDRLRRNHRQVKTHKAFVVATNVVLLLTLSLGGFWLFRRTQQDLRFAVKQVEMVGARQTSKAALDELSARYLGQNLFRIEIAQLRKEVGALPWVERIEIEKKLPDRLVVHIFERRPVALTVQGGRVRYVDAGGVIFTDLSPAGGNAALPLVAGSTAEEIRSCVSLVSKIRVRDRPLYDSLSEVRFLPPNHFLIFDRGLRSVLYADGETLSDRWRALRGILSAEGAAGRAIEYADLRFPDRIVVKPFGVMQVQPIVHSSIPAAITN